MKCISSSIALLVFRIENIYLNINIFYKIDMNYTQNKTEALIYIHTFLSSLCAKQNIMQHDTKRNNLQHVPFLFLLVIQVLFNAWAAAISKSVTSNDVLKLTETSPKYTSLEVDANTHTALSSWRKNPYSVIKSMPTLITSVLGDSNVHTAWESSCRHPYFATKLCKHHYSVISWCKHPHSVIDLSQTSTQRYQVDANIHTAWSI